MMDFVTFKEKLKLLQMGKNMIEESPGDKVCGTRLVSYLKYNE